MDKEFVPYAEALELKELGFDEPCFKVVEGGPIDIFPYKKLDVPLYQQAFRWFREKYGLMHIINPYYFTAEINYLNKRVVDTKYGDFIPHDHLVNEEGEEIKYSSYEEAETACLKKLIEIAKETK
jgi:hypothetical protein